MTTPWELAMDTGISPADEPLPLIWRSLNCIAPKLASVAWVPPTVGASSIHSAVAPGPL
jgi:hypothetical protein